MPREPIAVLIADLHLSLAQPSCRADKDWMAVQAHYLAEVKSYKLPVVCAGDIFDKWNPQPELIHFALEHLPTGMICVPGQHDLPFHQVGLMHRSAYGVLVKAKKIRSIHGGGSFGIDGALLHGFGWNEPIGQPKVVEVGINVAVVHRYCWTADSSYPGAPEDSHLGAYKKALKHYETAVFGDNHKGFVSYVGNCNVLNCGGFIRRKSDELDYQPCVGLLHSDGSLKREKLDTRIDKFHENNKPDAEAPVDMRAFLKQLEELDEVGLDFKSIVARHLRKEETSPEVKQIILEALDAKS